MAVAKVELTGGNFQDAEGNVLALGYLKMRLSQDSEVNDSMIASGVEITINLDASGNAVAGQYVWGNDVLLPINSYYTVTGYTAQGQPAWGPNNQQIVGTGTFDLGSWIPNQVISWVPSVQAGTAVQVNGTALSSPSVANFENTSTVTFTDAGAGVIEATASAPTPNCLPQPDAARFAMWEASLTANYYMIQIGDAVTVGDIGTPYQANPASAIAGVSYQMTGGNYYGWFWIWPTRTINFKCCATLVTPGNKRACWGVSTCDYSTADPSAIGDGVYLTYDPTLPNWQLMTTIGGSSTEVDSGVNASTSARINAKITVTGGVATLYINGAACCHSTSLPTIHPLGLNWWIGGSGTTIAAVEYMYADNASV
jgi:hypothetical protein